MGLGWWWKGAPFRRSGCGVGVDPWCCAQGTVNGRREGGGGAVKAARSLPLLLFLRPNTRRERKVGGGRGLNKQMGHECWKHYGSTTNNKRSLPLL